MAYSTWTTVPSFRKVLAVLLVLASVPAWSLDKAAYARSLEGEGDWYRAIGQWKELRFEAGDSHSYWEANQQILFDLWQAGQFEAGQSEAARLAASPRGASFGVPDSLALWRGLFLYKQSRFAEADFQFTKGGSPAYTGLLLARGGRLEAANAAWKGLGLPDPAALAVDSRSPLLAAALSAVLPGAGQAYSGHWFDGFQALAFNSLFGVAAYGTYLYDSKVSSHYGLTAVVGGVAVFFYASNLYGAYKTAEYFNQNQDNARTAYLESAVFGLGLPKLIP